MNLCGCGCGLPTEPYRWSNKRIHAIKGCYARFIPGHNMRNHQYRGSLHPRWKGRKISSQGYVWVYAPGHPRNTQGYIYEHTLLAERALGRFLPQGTMVHHYSVAQLVICQDQAYHMLLEKRTRALRACGHVNWGKCWICGKYDAPENLIDRKLRNVYHYLCRQVYGAIKYLEKTGKIKVVKEQGQWRFYTNEEVGDGSNP